MKKKSNILLIGSKGKLGSAIIGFETGYKDDAFSKLNISDKQILQAIKESREERPNSIYSQMKNSGMSN